MTQTNHKPARTLSPGRRSWLATGLLPILTLLPACSSAKHINPSFPLTTQQAKADLKQMCADPVTLDRPVVVLGGWGDMLGIPPAQLAKQLRTATGDDRIISIGFGGCLTFDACRKRVLKRIEEAFPSDSDDWTTDVDVIGFSMGGIVARYTAGPPTEEEVEEAVDTPPVRRLRINRLYTLCTPHRGALMSTIIAPGRLARNMKPGSEFMQQLDYYLASADFTITPYARLNDRTVGEANAAPLGQHPYWVPAAPFTIPHADAYRDPRLIADLAKRLRNETPYTTEPVTPLPE